MTVLIHPRREKYNMKQNVFVGHVDSAFWFYQIPEVSMTTEGRGYLGDIYHPEIGPR